MRLKEHDLVMLTGNKSLVADPEEYMTMDGINERGLYEVQDTFNYFGENAVILLNHQHCYASSNFTKIGTL